jgi:hypothetical protein
MASSSRSLGQTAVHYRILRMIGAGGMGAVYEAEDPKPGSTSVSVFLRLGRVFVLASKAELHRKLDLPGIAGRGQKPKA